MTLEFLRPDAALITDSFSPVARGPMERSAHSSGARFEIRDRWNLAVAYGRASLGRTYRISASSSSRPRPVTWRRWSRMRPAAPRSSSAARPVPPAPGGAQ